MACVMRHHNRQMRAFTYSRHAWKLIVNTLREGVEDDLLDRAAGLSFYFLFSLFPLMLLLAALLSIFHASDMIRNAIAVLSAALPHAAAHLVAGQLWQLLRQPHDDLLSLSTLLLLYSGSQGISGLMTTLNIAYEVPETRAYPHRLGLSILLTISAGLFLAIGLALVLLGSKLLAVIFAARNGVPGFHWAVQVMRGLLATIFLVIAIYLLYRFAPDVDWKQLPTPPHSRPRSALTRGIWPAALAAIALWAIASIGLSVYMAWIGNDATVYGSLGAVIALMLWFYLGALAILLGAEFHCEWLKLRGVKLHTIKE